MNKIVIARCAIVLLTLLAACDNNSVEQKTQGPATDTSNPTDYFGQLMQKSSTLPGVTYEVVYTMGTTVTTSKMAVEGEKTRIDSPGDASFTIIDENETMTYDPKTNTAMVMKDTDGPEDMFDIHSVSKSKMKLLDKTAKNGYACQMIETSEDESGSTMKICMSEEYGLPVYVEAVSKEGKMMVEYKNIKVGKLPPKTFTIPAGAKIIDMSKAYGN